MGANTREIRTRIKSVKNTEKITKAMQMVAAAKVRRAQDRVLAAKPYAEALASTFAQVASQLGGGEYRNPLLTQRQVQAVALVVITSDKGLCGGYNANVIKKAVARLRELKAEGKAVKLILVGTKAAAFFKHSNFDVHAQFTQLPQIPTFAEAQAVVSEATGLYAAGTVDAVEIVTTEFRSMVALVPVVRGLLPATAPEAEKAKTPQALLIVEPSPAEVMDAIVPKYLETVVYQALLEAAASELAAKMTAMSAASKNAKELAAALTLVYNKARQAAITQEILEVVGGANAL